MEPVHWNGKSRLERIYDTPVKALNPSARRLLGTMLDPPRHTFSSTGGIQQDWQGLAECMGLSYEDIQVYYFNPLLLTETNVMFYYKCNLFIIKHIFIYSAIFAHI